MENILNRFKRSETPKLDKVTRENKCSYPWLITEVVNGLKAVNGNPTYIKFLVNKKLKTQYYEYDRIFGKGAFSSKGVLRVTDLFEELKRITPYTEYFIFAENDYINRDDGILKKNHRNGEEMFFSNETLQNENLANYFSLTYGKQTEAEIEIELNETNIDRTTVHNQSTELANT